MTAYRRDDLRWRVATIVRDTSWATLSVINDYLDDVYKLIYHSLDLPEAKRQVKLTAGATNTVEFSGADTRLKTYNIIDIMDPNGINKVVKYTNQQGIDGALPRQDGQSGYPQLWWPANDHQAYVWPYGTTTEWTVNYMDEAADFSADSMDASDVLPDVAMQTLIEGTVARIFDWKDDDRAMKYDARFQQGMKVLRKQYENPFADKRMRPSQEGFLGDSTSWIYGDYISG